MALRFKTVEELNMEVKVEPTVEEQVQELKGLVVEDIKHTGGNSLEDNNK